MKSQPALGPTSSPDLIQNHKIIEEPTGKDFDFILHKLSYKIQLCCELKLNKICMKLFKKMNENILKELKLNSNPFNTSQCKLIC